MWSWEEGEGSAVGRPQGAEAHLDGSRESPQSGPCTLRELGARGRGDMPGRGGEHVGDTLECALGAWSRAARGAGGLKTIHPPYIYSIAPRPGTPAGARDRSVRYSFPSCGLSCVLDCCGSAIGQGEQGESGARRLGETVRGMWFGIAAGPGRAGDGEDRNSNTRRNSHMSQANGSFIPRSWFEGHHVTHLRHRMTTITASWCRGPGTQVRAHSSPHVTPAVDPRGSM